MPYKDNSELPDWVQKQAKNFQDVWREAFNAVHVETKDEGRAASAANAAVQKAGYRKKGDAWVKLEGSYVKDLLYPGKFPHPQDPARVVNMTPERIAEIGRETIKYLDAGGKIPLTISHPHGETRKQIEEEKIASTEGFVGGVFVDPADGRLYAHVDFLDAGKARSWVEDGKLTSVSPAVFHGVTTSVGTFPVLIDHVALTASPHLLTQGPFLPINAESYRQGLFLFEANGVEYDMGFVAELNTRFVELLHNIKEIFHAGQPGAGNDTKGEDMELKELQDKNAQLEAQVKDLGAKLTDLEAKVKGYQDKEQAALEAEAKNELDSFNARVDGLVKEGKVLGPQKEKLVAEFGQLKGLKTIGDKPVADFLLERFKDAKPVTEKNEIPANAVKLDSEIVDLSTLDGKDKFADAVMKLAREKAKAKGPDADPYDFVAESRIELLEKGKE